MNIYRAEYAEGRKMMDPFGLERIPADISDEMRAQIEETLIEETWINYEEVYIITEGQTDNGESVIFCFVKAEERSLSGRLMLLVLGEKPQIYTVRTCYNEGEMLYGQAEIFPGNVLSYYDLYIVQGISARQFFCFYEDDSRVEVRINADYSNIIGDNPFTRINEEDYSSCYVEVTVDGNSHIVESDEFYPEISPEQVKERCDIILEEEKKRQKENRLSDAQAAIRYVSRYLSDKLEDMLPDDEFGPREFAIIRLRLGLDDDRPRTREEAAREFCIPEAWVMGVEEKLRRYTENSSYYSEIEARLECEYAKEAEIAKKFGHTEEEWFASFNRVIMDIRRNILTKNGLTADYTLSTAAIEVSEDTAVEIGPQCSTLTKADLIMETDQIEKKLTGKARGLALNLLPQEKKHLLYEDGIIESRNLILEDPVVSMKVGSTVGSVKHNISVSATVHQPNHENIRTLLKADLPYDLASITFGLYLSEADEDGCKDKSWLTWMNKMRRTNTVICSDSRGIQMMVAEDVYITVKFDEDTSLLYLKISTRYPSQMKYKLKDEAVVKEIIDAVLDGGRPGKNETIYID